MKIPLGKVPYLFLLVALVASTVWAMPGAAPGGTRGKVLEALDAGGYTYLRLEVDGGERWIAGPQTAVRVGDEVIVPAGSPMNGFESPSLNRTFEQLDFVGAIQVAGADSPAAGLPPGHPSVGAEAAAAPKMGPLKRPEKGLTVAEVFEQRKGLEGKTVLLRARVVKANEGIMGKNWFHVQDGTGKPGSNDLTVTSQDRAKVGDQVLVEGKVVLDRDFGSGYRYDLLLEESEIKVEPSA